MNELSSAEPIPTFWRSEFNQFLDTVREAEAESHWQSFGQNWSGHVHVEARDLTRAELVRVVILGQHLFDLAPTWFTGWSDGYNSKTDREELTEWQAGRGRVPSRQSWISVSNLGWSDNPQPYKIGDTSHGKTTVEFRRYRVTLDPKLIMARGAVSRALVEYAKNNTALFWAMRHNNFLELCREIGVGKH